MNAETAVPNEERIHHPFSPSSLQNREACAKFTNRQSTNAAAILGTIQHDAVERGEDDYRLTDSHAMAVASCVDFAEERAALYPGGRIVKEVYLPIDDEVHVIDVLRIEKFDIYTDDGQVSPGFRGVKTQHVFEGTTAGYLDFAVVSADETEAEIIDWKFGRNAVTEAKDNLQGISYMLGLKKIFPNLRKCWVRFVQPHIDEKSEHLFDLTNTDELYLRIRTVVGRAVEAAKNPQDFSAARPNVGTCLFCAHVGRCPAVAQMVIQLGQKFKPLQIPDNVTPTTISDPADVGVGLRLADVAKTWAEAFRRQATEKTISDPDFVPPGYKLVTMVKRKLLNPQQFAEMAKRFLPPEMHAEVDKLFDIPLGPVEELISTAAPRGSKEKTVEEFGARLLDAGVVELGQPFAFLRQSTKKDSAK